MSERWRKIIWLSVFAGAMAYLEAAVVVYLRRIYYPENPLSLFPLKVWDPHELLIEIGREGATVFMILATALLAERGRLRSFAAFAFVFGLWDLLYYFWLKVLIGWPAAWFEWDILFLIPWIWLGPWPAPAIVALLLSAWGGWVILAPEPPAFGGLRLSFLGAGMLLVIGSFLRPILPFLAQDMEGVARFVPGEFPWIFYGIGIGIMAAAFFTPGRPGEGRGWRGEEKG